MTDSAMIQGRREDSARRRQRVIKAINEAGRVGGQLSVSAIARSAGVDRTSSTGTVTCSTNSTSPPPSRRARPTPRP